MPVRNRHKETSAGLYTGTRAQRVLWAVVMVALVVYSNSAPSPAQRALRQQVTWTIGVFAYFLMELHRTLLRSRQALIGLALLILHFFVMYVERDIFPFESNFFLFFLGMLFEAFVLTIVYLRLGQSIDPQGPFGMTEAEKRKREKLRVDLLK